MFVWQIMNRTQQWGELQDEQEHTRGMNTWMEGKTRALSSLATDTFDEESKPIKLTSRKLHSSMPECPQCADIRLESQKLRKEHASRARHLELREKRVKHQRWFMGERRALVQAVQIAARDTTSVYWARDKCGDDMFWLPSPPARTSMANTGHFRYRMALQAEQVPDRQLIVSLVPPSVKTGANYSCSSMLHAIIKMQDQGTWTAETRTAFMNSDGGSDMVNWVQHGIICVLLHERVLDELYFYRLPPTHHHELADRTFGILEGLSKKAGFGGVDTPWDMIEWLRETIKTSKAFKGMASTVQFHMVNHNFEALLQGCVDGQFKGYKDVRVWRYTRNEDGTVKMHYKHDLANKGDSKNDEWGPWIEVERELTDDQGTATTERCNKTDPDGINIMLKFPDISKSPGFEDFRDAEEWKQREIFRDLGSDRWKYGAGHTEEKATKNSESYTALGKWHAGHSDVKALGTKPMPIR